MLWDSLLVGANRNVEKVMSRAKLKENVLEVVKELRLGQRLIFLQENDQKDAARGMMKFKIYLFQNILMCYNSPVKIQISIQLRIREKT